MVLSVPAFAVGLGFTVAVSDELAVQPLVLDTVSLIVTGETLPAVYVMLFVPDPAVMVPPVIDQE
jgi:hypothetical protein